MMWSILPETNIAYENPIFPGTMAMLVYRSVVFFFYENGVDTEWCLDISY